MRLSKARTSTTTAMDSISICHHSHLLKDRFSLKEGNRKEIQILEVTDVQNFLVP